MKVNEFFRKLMLETFEAVELLLKARVEEEEIQVGLFRVPVPNYDRRAFREAVVNAVVHRDFNRLGAVHVRLDAGGLTISNPGGFVEGVNLRNLVVADPRSRNPLLADAVKRIGLAERPGRGVDRIFEGMLRYGRPAPDYPLSDDFTVSVSLSNAAADLDFLKLVVEQEGDSGLCRSIPSLSCPVYGRNAGSPPPISPLPCRNRRRMSAPRWNGWPDLTLSARLYRKAGKKAEYVRQVGFNPIQQDQMVLSYIDKHGSIKRAEVMDLCHLTKDQASKFLNKMAKENRLEMHGERRGAYYVRKSHVMSLGS